MLLRRAGLTASAGLSCYQITWLPMTLKDLEGHSICSMTFLNPISDFVAVMKIDCRGIKRILDYNYSFCNGK